MPWRACSKIASRKSKLAALLVIILILPATPAAAEDLGIEARHTAPNTLSIRVTRAPTDRIAATLESGLRAELDLILRVFEPVEGIAGLLGDRLVAEHRIATEARIDPFADGYRLSTRRPGDGVAGAGSGGGGPDTRVFSRIDDAVTELLTLREVSVPSEARRATSGTGTGSVAPESPGRYVLAQARLRPLRLVERLRIIALATPRYTLRSAWVRIRDPEAAR